jgi:hypothetical protein
MGLKRALREKCVIVKESLKKRVCLREFEKVEPSAPPMHLVLNRKDLIEYLGSEERYETHMSMCMK